MDKYEKIQWKILDALWVGLTVLLVISVPAFGASPGMTGEAETVETVSLHIQRWMETGFQKNGWKTGLWNMRNWEA